MKLDLGPRYCAFYCEENVWHLAGDCIDAGIEARVVFASNARREIAAWHQRAAPRADAPIAWDYHVFLAARGDGAWRIEDVDSRLPRGIDACDYVEATFPALPPQAQRFTPLFRVIDAPDYRAALCTDRSHMRRPDGTWRRPPPAGPPIGEGTNVMRFVDMQADFAGRVMSRAELLRAFAER